MSVNKLGIVLFSGFLALATAPFAPAQSTTTQDTTTKKPTTTQKGTTTNDQSTQSDQSTSTKSTSKTAKSKSQTTHNTADKDNQSTTKAKKTKKGTTDKKSSMSDEKVRQTQVALKNQGFDPGPVDGVMGPMTMAAIRNYQMQNHLQETGMLNPETENALMARAGTNGQGGQSGFGDRSSLSQSQNDTHGNVTDIEDVRQVQQSLADLGYTPGDINGMMSSDTQNAVSQFQWMNNLPVTGNLDERTNMAIMSQGQGTTANAQLSQNPTTLSDQEREKSGIAGDSAQPIDNTYKQDATSTSRSKPSAQDSTGSYDAKHHDNVSGKVDKDAAERAQKAADVLQDLTAASDKRIPNEILEHAEGIAVIPHMIKGAFGIGGRFGKGLVAERTDGGRWSAPAFIEIGGGSFGAQLGVEATDLVLVFTDRKALDLLEGGRDLKLGADASIAAGPIGRSGEAGVNANLKSAIYAYSRAKGLFAGIALDGAVLNMDKSTNQKVYGSSVDSKQILAGIAPANASVQPFMTALDRVAPRKHISQR
jgi:lipid-binding SYLF domain-containing protein